MSEVILKIDSESALLFRSLTKIKALSKDLFATGHILTVDYCREIYRIYLHHIKSNYCFEELEWETRDTLRRMKEEFHEFKVRLGNSSLCSMKCYQTG